VYSEEFQNDDESWKLNALINPKVVEPPLADPASHAGLGRDVDMVESINSGRKRPAINSNSLTCDGKALDGTMVAATSASTVADMIGKFDDAKGQHSAASPQKNANKKKLKGDDGVAVDKSPANNIEDISAASLEDDRPVQ
jgi:hypothetical protein